MMTDRRTMSVENIKLIQRSVSHIILIFIPICLLAMFYCSACILILLPAEATAEFAKSLILFWHDNS